MNNVTLILIQSYGYTVSVDEINRPYSYLDRVVSLSVYATAGAYTGGGFGGLGPQGH